MKTPNNTIIRRNRVHVTPAAAPRPPGRTHTNLGASTNLATEGLIGQHPTISQCANTTNDHSDNNDTTNLVLNDTMR